MDAIAVLNDGIGRVRDGVHEVLADLGADQLNERLEGTANSIAWLVWHLTRVQDDHLSEAAGREQAWHCDGWVERFGLAVDPAATGYGQRADEVAAVRVDSPDLLLGYYDAVHDRSLRFLAGLTEADLDRVIDRSWDPPVTVGVRLVSVIDDDAQHVGQAALIRGVLTART